MADLETRLIAEQRLRQRQAEKHKKEVDRLHRRIRQLESREPKCKTCENNRKAEQSEADHGLRAVQRGAFMH